jgi:hypothetical protein
MDRETLQARIHHELAEFQAGFPQIRACRSTLDEWQDEGGSHYALRLDIRWPEHQTLVSGEAKDSPLGAVRAALDAARRQLQQGATVRALRP